MLAACWRSNPDWSGLLARARNESQATWDLVGCCCGGAPASGMSHPGLRCDNHGVMRWWMAHSRRSDIQLHHQASKLRNTRGRFSGHAHICVVFRCISLVCARLASSNLSCRCHWRALTETRLHAGEHRGQTRNCVVMVDCAGGGLGRPLADRCSKTHQDTRVLLSLI